MTNETIEFIPADDAERLEAIRRYDILDTPADGTFDRITRLAAALFQVPISIVSIVDHDRIWFKSKHGLDVSEIGRDPGLCASAILDDELWLIEDAKNDPRSLANPLVAGEFGLRFYAGVPLKVSGHNFGTLCIIDRAPRAMSEAERQVLSDLAAIVCDEIELRLNARQVAADARYKLELADQRTGQVAQLNDDIVQVLAVAKLTLQMGDSEKALASVDSALDAGKELLADMTAEAQSLRRSKPALQALADTHSAN